MSTDAPDHAHASLMDDVYRYQRHIYDASRRYFLLGRDAALAHMSPLHGDDCVLELGCGTARNLIKLGRGHPGLRLFGLDASEQMLSTARQAASRAGAAGRMRLVSGDACRFDPQDLFGQKQFERVLLSYMLSMVPQWERVIEAAMAVLAPGGKLVVVDFGAHPRLPSWFRSGLRAWLARFHVEPRDQLWGVFQTLAHRHGLVDVRRIERCRGYAVILVARRNLVAVDSPQEARMP